MKYSDFIAIFLCHQFAFSNIANTLKVFSLQQRCRCYLLQCWGSGISIPVKLKNTAKFLYSIR
jgi:hypothetical protein